MESRMVAPDSYRGIPGCDGYVMLDFISLMGLAKKVIIADTFGIVANTGYAGVDLLSTQEAWITSLAYAVQLYFDFSGYSDRAIGLALMFNIRLPINFDSPYKSKTIGKPIPDLSARGNLARGRLDLCYLGNASWVGIGLLPTPAKVSFPGSECLGHRFHVSVRKYHLGILSSGGFFRCLLPIGADDCTGILDLPNSSWSPANTIPPSG
jgi:hypothetical protein